MRVKLDYGFKIPGKCQFYSELSTLIAVVSVDILDLHETAVQPWKSHLTSGIQPGP